MSRLVETEVMKDGGPWIVWKKFRWWNPTHWFKTKRYRLVLDNGPSKTVTVGGELDDAFEVVLRKLEEDTWEIRS